MARKNFAPPQALSVPARALWRRIVNDFEIVDAAGLHLLQTACECHDRVLEAQALILEHGTLVRDRFGQLRSNPACAIERDARAAMMSAFKALRLDIEPVLPVGRPPRI